MIDLTKKYRARKGNNVLGIFPENGELFCVFEDKEYAQCSILTQWLTVDGKYTSNGNDNEYDLIEVSP